MWSSSHPRPYWATPPATHREVLARFYDEYDAGVANGTILPFVYPFATLGCALALAFFLFVPPSSRLHNVYSRWAVWLALVAWHAVYVGRSRGLNVATSFGIGIIMAFAALWAGVLLVFDDKKARARRVERTGTGTQSDRYRYYWQSYPMRPFSVRLGWVLDLWSNFRGVGFDFKPTGLPTYPLDVQKQLFPDTKPVDQPVSRTGIRRCDSLDALLGRHVRMLLMSYLVCDLLICAINRDAYFWGILDAPGPAWLPVWIRDSPSLWLKAYRMTMGMTLIWHGLRAVYCLAPICLAGMLGPAYLGVGGEPWLYPDHYGDYFNVFTRGLVGWWGGWWHQIFRSAFQAAGCWVTRHAGIDDASASGKLVHIWTAFVLSGVLHASGSAAQMGATNPLKGPMVFFLLQPVAIMAEIGWHVALKRAGLAGRLPRAAVYLANFAWVHAWFLLTAPLLVGDLAAGGLYLVQPFPVSLFRGLGLGVPGDGWWSWEGPYVRFHRGSSILTSGIAL